MAGKSALRGRLDKTGRNGMKNKKIRTGIIAILAVVLVITGAAILPRMQQGGGGKHGSGTGQDGQAQRQTAEETEEKDGDAADEAYRSLGEPDRQTAAIYAELYETSPEEVAVAYVQTNDWEKTGKALEKQFFTIPENTKYRMEEDDYSPEDMEEAEQLSVRTGIRASELIQAKGKASDGKSWEEVKKEKGIEEEQGTDAE